MYCMSNLNSGEYDGVAVMGGGIESTTGEIHPWVKNRFDRAAELSSPYLFALSRGTPNILPVLDPVTHYPIDESLAGMKYFVDKYGDQGRKLILDTWSMDSIGNLYWLRTRCEEMKLRRLAIVTSEFQEPRTRAISEWVFGLKPSRTKFDIAIEPVENVGMDEATLSSRIEREAKSTESVLANKARITTVAEFSDWIHTQHGAYSFEGLKSRKPLSGPITKSY
jgi:hypothetical protein